jgi:branched-chain amino acid transport system ATP-binding protein
MVIRAVVSIPLNGYAFLKPGERKKKIFPEDSLMAILECRRVCKRFGALAAVQEVSFTLGPGEALGMIGPNGAGKTTLFNCLTGMYGLDDGQVVLHGKDITRLKPHQICRLGLAKTAQIMEPFRAMTVFENVLVAALHGGRMRMAEARKETQEVLEFVGLADQSAMVSANTSVPDRRRLELARVLATRADVLLLDENMAGLNPVEIESALELLRKIRASGKSLIVVEHIMAAVMGISDRIIVLNYGAKIAEGTPQEVVRNEQVIAAYLGSKSSSFGKSLGMA